MLPADWAERFIDALRGRAPAELGWFRAGPILDEAAQVGVYAEQLTLRLREALADDLQGLCWLLGDEAEPLLDAYAAAFPSDSWTLNGLARHLPGWLEARGAPDEQVDMARLDLAVAEGFLAADAPGLRPAQIQPEARLALAPHVRLLRVRSNVAERRAAVSAGEPPPPRLLGEARLAVFRAELRMHHLTLPEGAHALLSAFSRGASVAEAVGEALPALQRSGAVGPQLQEWFTRFSSRGLLALADPR